MDEPLLYDCQFQLVFRYNPIPDEKIGQEIEPEVLCQIFLDLTRQFGNYTPLGIVGIGNDEKDAKTIPGGTWEGQSEPSVRIEVAVPAERIRELEAFVYNVGVRLKQKAMYFKTGTPCVKIIKIQDEGETRAGEKGGCNKPHKYRSYSYKL